MKICYLNKGITIHDKTFLAELLRQGNEVHLISFYRSIPENLPGINIHHFPVPNPVLAFPIACVMARRLIRRIRPDIVIGNYLHTYAFYAALAHYHPLVQRAWAGDALIAPNNPFYRQLVKYSLKQADLAIADWETVKQALVQLGCPAEKVVLFPNGVDFERFNPQIGGQSIRESMGWQDNLIVICTRQHDPVYGVEYLIEAIPPILMREPVARFLLIGSGSLTKKLKRRVKELGVGEYVMFTGMIDHEELPKYLAASDLFVSSSLFDGAAVSLLEAMATGLPVVVTDVPALLDWVTDGENGLVVPRKDSSALEQAICRMLGDKNLRETFGRKNYLVAKEKADWDKNSKILDGILRSLVRDKVR